MTITANETKALKFGLSGFKNPTPKGLTYFFRVVSFLVGLWALVQHLGIIKRGLSAITIADINEIAVLTFPILHLLVQSFGWDYKIPQYGNFDPEKDM